MTKSLKRIAEPDTFNYGKAVTLILSQTKELNKTRNTLVDDVSFLEARKKQETQALERLIAEKAELIKIKDEVTAKIMAQKSEFTDMVTNKRQELATIEANLKLRETTLAETSQKTDNLQVERQNELELRSADFKKEIQTSMEALNKRESVLIAREEVVTTITNQNSAEKLELDGLQNKLKAMEQSLHENDEARANKKLELDNREAKLADKEHQLDAQRLQLSNLAADLENQASLIEREKSKNKSDTELLKTMTKNIKDKQLELNTREIHLNDREATAMSHGARV